MRYHRIRNPCLAPVPGSFPSFENIEALLLALLDYYTEGRLVLEIGARDDSISENWL